MLGGWPVEDATALAEIVPALTIERAPAVTVTLPASPMIGTSIWMFLLIEDGSMSMWIFLEPGENASMRPVMRSSKRAPTHNMTSQPCIVMLAS